MVRSNTRTDVKHTQKLWKARRKRARKLRQRGNIILGVLFALHWLKRVMQMLHLVVYFTAVHAVFIHAFARRMEQESVALKNGTM